MIIPKANTLSFMVTWLIRETHEGMHCKLTTFLAFQLQFTKYPDLTVVSRLIRINLGIFIDTKFTIALMPNNLK